MAAYGIQIGVVLGPSLVPLSLSESLFEARDGFLRHVQHRVGARDVVEHGRIFGVDRQGSLRPLQRAVSLAGLNKRGSAQVQGANILRVELQMFLDDSKESLPRGLPLQAAP